MTTRRSLLVGATAVATLAILGCGRGDRAFANMPSDTMPLVLGPGDLLIANTDASMELAVAGDKVILRFGERVRRQLRRDLDTSKVSGSGIGASIERAVKRTVGSALSRRIEYPLADIDSVRYDGDRIVFSYRVRHSPSFESMKNDNRDVLSTFSAADARRFVDAVRARKGLGPATAPSAGVDTTTMTRGAGGLFYKDLVVGTGPAVAAGQHVSVHYRGTLMDGTQFDANGPNDPPYTFRLGAGDVVPGFDHGVTGMHVGGRRQVVIPPAMGYGAGGSGPIPPNATLVFTIEVVSAR